MGLTAVDSCPDSQGRPFEELEFEIPDNMDALMVYGVGQSEPDVKTSIDNGLCCAFT